MPISKCSVQSSLLWIFFYLSALNKNLEKVLPFCFANTLSWREPVLNEHSQSTIVVPLGQQKLKTIHLKDRQK